ncbi:divergent PAP2 family protein [Paenibacillus sp. LHD-117]|uniref:divergent PAP2 family protein n=1 Tax=Paenibacillus sp. LHD-117 TaxID=3071412 RepID=UPI0027DF7B6B|nr:divergent PAP2 family protein [Paenibacillus sp. LHD-117]MDQ6422846.1 divergent PAP2 family protein [Paenibacillus sp. LHD-117]
MANRGLITAIAAVGAAQLLKPAIHYWQEGEWRPGKLVGSGGMPSSHSSGVSALAAYTAVKYGVRTPEFAIAAMLGIVVMYDAMNIRRHAGEIAIQVNDLDADVEKLAGHHPGIYHARRKEKLKESLGHQPSEVAAGAVLGALIGVLGAATARA